MAIFRSSIFTRLGLVAATGYIWFFYAERMFWSFWRPAEDSVPSFLITWFAYCVVAYACLLLVEAYKVRSVWSVFIVGAIFGWLVEGVFVTTFYGNAEAPFPISMSWTGLAWHAPLDVVIGWFLLQKALMHSTRRVALVAGLLGAFWGLWSTFWVVDGAAVGLSGDAFFTHALGITLVLMVMQRAYYSLGSSRFVSTRTERIVVGGVVLNWFCFVTYPTVGPIALALLPCLFVLYLALRKNKKTELGQTILESLDVRIPWRRSLAVLTMPIVAVVVHGTFLGLATVIHMNVVVLAVTTPLGFVLLGVSLWKVFRSKVSAPEAAMVQ